MSQTKELSNPFATGGGGASFEQRVQAVFVLSMLTDMPIPIFKHCRIQQIMFQARHAGYYLDDLIVFAANHNDSSSHKLLCQIKHSIHITASNAAFEECLAAAWQDFQNKELFCEEQDALVFITHTLNSADVSDGVSLFHWARAALTASDFFHRVSSPKFSSQNKQLKLQAIRELVQKLSSSTLSDEVLWRLIKSIHILQYDLDHTSPLLASLNHHANGHLGNILLYVQDQNQTAATLSKSDLPSHLTSAFQQLRFPNIDADIANIHEHNQIILNGIYNRIGSIHIPRNSIIQSIQEKIADCDILFIEGDRGVGKSAIAQDYIQTLENPLIITLRAEELDAPHFRQVLENNGIHTSLKELSCHFDLYENRIIIIESLERVLESQNIAAFSDLLHLLSSSRFKAICTIRKYALNTLLFNYFSKTSLQYSILSVPNFTEKELESIATQLPQLASSINNPHMHSFVSNPFFLQSIFTAQQIGYSFNKTITTVQVRKILWAAIVQKTIDRSQGLPLKREKAFIDLAVQRAKEFRYAIPQDSFDLDALLKLEADGLISLYNGMVSINHDVMEDWAICHFIDQVYLSYKTDISMFFQKIGNEPAINRGFRLWLGEKLDEGEEIIAFVKEILTILPNTRWAKEVFAALIQGNMYSQYLHHLEELLLANQNELLLQLCFVIRVSQQIPDSYVDSYTIDSSPTIPLIIMRPLGECWDTTLSFLLSQINRLEQNQYMHYIRFVSEWSNCITMHTSLPSCSAVAGQFAMQLLQKAKSHYHGKEIEKLLSVLTKVYPTIRNDFCKILQSRFESDSIHTLGYRLAAHIISSTDAAFMAQYDADLLIKIAKECFLLPETLRHGNNRRSYSPIDNNHEYGLADIDDGYYSYHSSSGLRQPFWALFRFTPLKAIHLCVDLCNAVTEALINFHFPIESDSQEKLSDMMCTVKLNDGTIVRQFASYEFWCAYRGLGSVPIIIQSMLMAMENSLIELVQYAKSNQDDPEILDQICIICEDVLRNSTSVMPTAVLAAVATGFYQTLGSISFPFLRTFRFYQLDIQRKSQERLGSFLNWSHMERFTEEYNKERRKSNAYPWRTQCIDDLAVFLQFTEHKDQITDFIDELDTELGDDIDWRFTKERIDTRHFTCEYQEEEKRYVFSSPSSDEELEGIRREHAESRAISDQYLLIFVWVSQHWERATDTEKYDPAQKFEEIKALLTSETSTSQSENLNIERSSLVKGIALLIRDNYHDLLPHQRAWCVSFILSAVEKEQHNYKVYIHDDRVNQSGVDACAYVLPFLFQQAIKPKEKNRIMKAITIAYTHPHLTVQRAVSEGVAVFLGSNNAVDYTSIIYGRLHYAIAKAKVLSQWKIAHLTQQEISIKYCRWLQIMRRFLAKTREASINISDFDFNLLSPCDLHILLTLCSPCNEAKQHDLIEKLLNQWFPMEMQAHHSRESDRENEIIRHEYFSCSIDFAKSFADYLWALGELEPYVEVLRCACSKAPLFVQSMMLRLETNGEKIDNVSRYWNLWQALSPAIEEICLHTEYAEYGRDAAYSQLIHTLMHYAAPWGQIDYEKQYIKTGKNHILSLAQPCAERREVFEGMTSLMLHFPTLFVPDGIYHLARIPQEKLNHILSKSSNAVFCLERVLHVVIIENSGLYLEKLLYDSCLSLLDGMVEATSSIAYYLREYLLQSKKIQ